MTKVFNSSYFEAVHRIRQITHDTIMQCLLQLCITQCVCIDAMIKTAKDSTLPQRFLDINIKKLCLL